MTAHYICPDTLQRRSASITLRRIIGKHTNDILSKNIQDILIEYKILSKIVKIVTDNGSNFVKALNPTEDNENDIMLNENVQVVNLTKILRNSSNSNIPLHQRCAAHTVNLCMQSDIKAALAKALKQHENDMLNELLDFSGDETIFNDEDFDKDVSIIDSAIVYKKISESTFKTCKALWSKQSRSSVAADLIKQSLGVYLKVPNETRWNSELDASTQLLDIIKKKSKELKEIFRKLQLNFLTTEEITFLDNYVKVIFL